jgi:hypothetical protein
MPAVTSHSPVQNTGRGHFVRPQSHTGREFKNKSSGPKRNVETCELPVSTQKEGSTRSKLQENLVTLGGGEGDDWAKRDEVRGDVLKPREGWGYDTAQITEQLATAL